MEHEERERRIAWMQRILAREEPDMPVSVGGLVAKLKRFPAPDVAGLSPEEAGAAWEQWLETVDAWSRETNNHHPAPAEPSVATSFAPNSTT